MAKDIIKYCDFCDVKCDNPECKLEVKEGNDKSNISKFRTINKIYGIIRRKGKHTASPTQGNKGKEKTKTSL